jgi:hypothetical protein
MTGYQHQGLMMPLHQALEGRLDELRNDVSAEDIAASLIGIFTVAPKPQGDVLASRLLNILMDGLRPPARR